jgi:molecular chaperone GrpE
VGVDDDEVWTQTSESRAGRGPAADIRIEMESGAASLLGEREDLRFELAERERSVERNTEDGLLKLLGVLDAFERVFANIGANRDRVESQTEALVGNFRSVHRLLKAVLTEQQVIRMDVLGLAFDPHWHAAEHTVARPDEADGTIVEEVTAGYMWRNRLLRKAQVVVVDNEAQGSAE